MAQSGTTNTHRDTYIEVDKYIYRHNAKSRNCKCPQFWGLLPTTFGFMTKSTSCFKEKNMVKVNIFSKGAVETLVRGMDKSLVESILDCDCTVCQRVLNVKTVERKAKVISDMELFSPPKEGVVPTGLLLSDKEVPPLSNNPPRDLGAGNSKAVLFAMLCYLGTPFMMYFDIWEKSSRDPGEFGLMRFHLDKHQVHECFRRLYELQEMAEGGLSETGNTSSVINEQTNQFLEAFQQVERQFQPLQLSSLEPSMVPGDVVFPFHDFSYRQHGGQAGIYVTKISGEFRKGFKQGHSTDDETFICKVIERADETGQDCSVGKAAHYEKCGMSRMKKLDHPNLIQMHLWFNFLNTRVFLLPCYHGDLDEFLTGNLDHLGFNPPRVPSPDPVGSSCYGFPTEGWLWKGMLGVLDGLVHFHGSAENQGVQATHLDLKPSNILISKTGEMVISDCGTSRVTHEYRRSLTTHSFVGTTAYSPPWAHREPGHLHPQPKLNQSFDVWSMACILLEVLIFIVQGKGGVNRFREAKYKTDMDGSEDITRRSSSRSTFWQFESREQNTFKLKSVVAEWLNRAYVINQLIEDNTDVLFRLVTRLNIMFQFNPCDRGTIDDCWRHLRGDQVVISNLQRQSKPLQMAYPLIHTNIEQDMIHILDEDRSNLFGDELGYIDSPSQAYRGIPETVSNLPLTYIRGNPSEECPCRIRIFEDQPRGIVTISIAFVLRRRIVLENVTLQRKLDFLSPKNLFDVHRRSITETSVTWGFTGLHQSQLFKTRDLKSFMAIQEALLGQKYIPESFFQLEACALQPWGFPEPRAITVKCARVEVWEEVHDSKKPWLPKVETPRSTNMSSTTSSNGSGNSRVSQNSQYAGKAAVSDVELGHNPRLVIYRKHGETEIDCITMKLRGRCIILKKSSDLVVSVSPKISYIPYYKIPLGTNNGLSLMGSDRVEVGKVQKAKIINLQFLDSNSLQQFKRCFENRSFLKGYFE